MNQSHDKQTNTSENTLKLLFLNINGLSTTHKQSILMDYIKDHNIDIGFVAETCMSIRSEQQFRQQNKDFTIISSYEPDQQPNSAAEGVIAIINNRIASRILYKRKIPGRAIAITIKHSKRRPVSIYGIYAPTSPHSPDGSQSTNRLIERLEPMLNEDIAKQHEIILGGDINSYADARLDYKGDGTGQRPSDLIRCLEQLSLTDSFRLLYPTSQSYSYSNQPFNDSDDYILSDGRMFSRLDACYCNNYSTRRLIDCNYEHIPFISTDHKAVISTFSIAIKGTRPTQNDRLIIKSPSQEQVTQWQDRCNSEVNRKQLLWDVPTDTGLQRLIKCMVKCGQRIFKRPKAKLLTKHPSKTYMILKSLQRCHNAEVPTQLLQSIITLFPSIDTSNNSSNYLRNAVIRESNRIHDMNLRKSITRRIRRNWATFSIATRRSISNLKANTFMDTSSVRTENCWITEGKQVKQLYLEHYKSIFCNQASINEEQIKQFYEHHDNPIGPLTYTIDTEEFEAALTSMANGKASGISMLPIEFIKWASGPIQSYILECMNQWLQSKSLPNYLLKSQLVPIPKPGFNGSTDKTRPINLLESLRKLYSKILTTRLTKAIDKKLHPNAFGFRPGKQCQDAIQVVRRIIDHAKTKNKQLLLACLDIRKAFDSLQPASIKKSLAFMGVDQDFIQLLQHIYDNRTYCILTKHGRTDSFHPTTGIEQGDALSPLIWNTFYEPLIRQLAKLPGYTVGNLNISCLTYADDIILAAENPEALENQLSLVHTFMSGHGMQLQLAKCFIATRLPTEQFIFNDTVIPQIPATESFHYLGADINLNHDDNLSITNTIKELELITKAIEKRATSDTMASYIHNICLLPIASYRLAGLTLNNAQLTRIDTFLLKFIKNKLKLPLSWPCFYHAIALLSICVMCLSVCGLVGRAMGGIVCRVGSLLLGACQ